MLTKHKFETVWYLWMLFSSSVFKDVAEGVIQKDIVRIGAHVNELDSIQYSSQDHQKMYSELNQHGGGVIDDPPGFLCVDVVKLDFYVASEPHKSDEEIKYSCRYKQEGVTVSSKFEDSAKSLFDNDFHLERRLFIPGAMFVESSNTIMVPDNTELAWMNKGEDKTKMRQLLSELSLVPSNSTSTATENANMEDLSWYIGYGSEEVNIKNPVDNSSLPVMAVNFTMSDRSYNVSLFKSNCQDPLQNEGIDIVETKVLQHNGSYKTVELTMEMNPKTITSSSIFVPNAVENNGGGSFQFCTIASLYLFNDFSSSGEINFKHIVFNMTLDMSGDLNLIIDIEKESAEEHVNTLGFSNYIKAYQCNKDRNDLGVNSPILTQGSILGVCVVSMDPSFISIDLITDLRIVQGDIKDFEAVSEGVSTAASLVTTDGSNCLDGVCMVRTIILAKFFNDDSLDIDVVGSVDLQLVRDSNTRRLQDMEVEETSSGFDITVKLDNAGVTAGAAVKFLEWSISIVSAAIFMINM